MIVVDNYIQNEAKPSEQQIPTVHFKNLLPPAKKANIVIDNQGITVHMKDQTEE